MKKICVVLSSCIISIFLSAGPVWSTAAPEVDMAISSLVEQLEVLNRSLARLVELQERVLGNQQVDLFLDLT
jgi:hypothetical protein